MVMRRASRLSVLLLPLLAAACICPFPAGWRAVDTDDVATQTRLLRAATCGEAPEIGLRIDESALSGEDKQMIDGLTVLREEDGLQILGPDGETLAPILAMAGIETAIGEETADALTPLVTAEIAQSAAPVAVILDLPREGFAVFYAQLRVELAAESGARLRAVETTGQVLAILSHESLRRLEHLPWICALYPDAMNAPAK